jgi:hypothetical protein
MDPARWMFKLLASVRRVHMPLPKTSFLNDFLAGIYKSPPLTSDSQIITVCYLSSIVGRSDSSVLDRRLRKTNAGVFHFRQVSQ